MIVCVPNGLLIFSFQTVFGATEAAKLSHLAEPQCSSNGFMKRQKPRECAALCIRLSFRGASETSEPGIHSHETAVLIPVCT
jgi:hypothetical protein